MSIEGSNVDFSVKNIPVNKPFFSVNKFGEISKANDSVTTLAEKTEIQIDKIPTDVVPKEPEQTNSLAGRISAFFSNVANSLAKHGKNFFTGCVVVIPFTAAEMGVAYLEGTLPLTSDFKEQVSFKGKISAFIVYCVVTPIIQEIICRKGIQDTVLSRVIIEKTDGGKKGWFDATTAKILRVGITTSLCGGYGISIGGDDSLNRLFKHASDRRDAISDIGLGIVCGQLKESKPGLLGAIGAHMTNNIINLLPILLA